MLLTHVFPETVLAGDHAELVAFSVEDQGLAVRAGIWTPSPIQILHCEAGECQRHPEVMHHLNHIHHPPIGNDGRWAGVVELELIDSDGLIAATSLVSLATEHDQETGEKLPSPLAMTGARVVSGEVRLRVTHRGDGVEIPAGFEVHLEIAPI